MTWPAVFDGIGAMFVRCDNDPDVQLARIHPSPTWVAVKVNAADASPPSEVVSWVRRAQPRATCGTWVYCYGPPEVDVGLVHSAYPVLGFVIYDVEAEYKTDEGAPADYPARLVAAHKAQLGSLPAAVTSYGAIPGRGDFPSSLDFRPFASAGWPILAQLYGDYDPLLHPEMQDCQDTYLSASGTKYPGPYPPEGVHAMYRRLALHPGQAVYRPEGIDG